MSSIIFLKSALELLKPDYRKKVRTKLKKNCLKIDINQIGELLVSIISFLVPENLDELHRTYWMKQRSDKKETKFLVPNDGPVNFAAVIDDYLNVIKSSLGHFTGRVFFKGTPAAYADQPMGKNLVSKVPCEMATVLGLDNPVSFTFHSLRRSSATAAADSGASVQQLMDFYGWSNPSMPQEYVSSSKASVKSMADKLQGPSNQVEKNRG